MTLTFDPGSEQAEGPFLPQTAMETIDIASGVFRDAAEDLERLRRKLASVSGDTDADPIRAVRL